MNKPARQTELKKQKIVRDSNGESPTKPKRVHSSIRNNAQSKQPRATRNTDKKIGRPPESVPKDTADEILNWIAHGKTLRDFCRQEGKPNWRTVYDWLEKDQDFSARFARARDMGADAIAEEALEIIDTAPEMAFSATGSHKDGAHVTWLKNRAEMRLKLLAKWNPRKYGEKVDLNHGVQPENPLTSLIQRIAGTGLPVVKDVPEDDE